METTNNHWWNPAQSLNRLLLSPTLAKRGLAMMIDLVIVSALQFAISQVFGVSQGGLATSSGLSQALGSTANGAVIGGDGYGIGSSQLAAMPYLWLIVIVVAYFTMFEYLFGATPGKGLLRLRVVSLDGRRLTLRALLTRNIFRLVDTLPLLYIVGGLVAQSTIHEQRVGDIIANTTVTSLAPRAANDASDSSARRRVKLKLLLVGVVLAALVGGAGAFQYYGRGPLVIQSWANLYNDQSATTVTCGAFQPSPFPASYGIGASNFQTPGRIFQYAIGAPQWGNGVVTYPVRMQMWNSAHDAGIGPVQPILAPSIAAVGTGQDIYNGSITLRWAGPLSGGWVMQSGQLIC